MGTILSDIPKTLTPGKAKNLLVKIKKELLLGVNELKHDLELEAEIIEELGVEKSEWLDTINYHTKELKTYTRDYIKLVKAVKKSVDAHETKKKRSK